MPETRPQHRPAPPPPTAEQQEDARLEEQEKLLDGRSDVNYPALLTQDVKGG